jgi:asparagine synthase (glutamine-hydrolysing)
MCGVAGYFGSQDIPAERVERCLKLMRRRGPDAAAAYRHRTSNGRTGLLLHSRLSIIDLDERSNQPFRFADKVLSFGGEIYNYLELRPDLARTGPTFKTSGDTEVLIRLLADMDGGALDRAEGMWSFALFDEASERLMLSRDRFGEKPLYVMREQDGIYFGSEVKFIAELAGGWPSIDLDHLRRYMVNGYKALYKQPHGFFHGVREVAPGTSLVIDRHGGERAERYWQAARLNANETMAYGDAVALVREALIRSVKLRLRADVPLAFCLSGGVDSNALIAIAKRVFGYDVHGFTIMNSDARYDEREMVEVAVREMELRHTAVPIERTDFLANLRTLVRQHDCPVYTITYYVQWQLMQQIAAHRYKVSISGTGADELFSGYFDHHNMYLAEVRHDPARHAEALADWRQHIAPIVRNPFLQDPDVFTRSPDERRHIYLNSEEFAGHLVCEWSEPFAEERYEESVLRNRMLNELFHEAVPPILHEDDLNAMYYSIENRSPYLDRTLFETMMRIPTRHLVRRGRAKALLRDAVADIAPKAVIDNPRKVGFNAPILDLLDVADSEVRAALLDHSPIFDVVRRDRIEALIGRRALPNSESKFLFYFINAKIFLEEFANLSGRSEAA